MSSTVRFTKIVDQAGKPRLHVLWGAPASDKNFQQAVRSKRVMTIRQENVGSKKDFGLIGFSQEAPAQFLIFPRTLEAYEGQRVVGINYELFEPSPEPGSAFKTKEPAAKKKAEPTSTSSLAKALSAPANRRRLVEREPEEPKTDKATSADDVAPAPLAHASPAVKTSRAEAPATKRRSVNELNRGAVLKELKSAMKELEAGKAVLVFRRLEKLSERLAADA